MQQRDQEEWKLTGRLGAHGCKWNQTCSKLAPEKPKLCQKAKQLPFFSQMLNPNSSFSGVGLCIGSKQQRHRHRYGLPAASVPVKGRAHPESGGGGCAATSSTIQYNTVAPLCNCRCSGPGKALTTEVRRPPLEAAIPLPLAGDEDSYRPAATLLETGGPPH